MNRILIIMLLTISMSFGMVNSEIPILEYDYPEEVDNAVHYVGWGHIQRQNPVPYTEDEKRELFLEDWCYVKSGRGQRITIECIDLIIDAHMQPLKDRLDVLENELGELENKK